MNNMRRTPKNVLYHGHHSMPIPSYFVKCKNNIQHAFPSPLPPLVGFVKPTQHHVVDNVTLKLGRPKKMFCFLLKRLKVSQATNQYIVHNTKIMCTWITTLISYTPFITQAKITLLLNTYLALNTCRIRILCILAFF